MPPFSMIMRNEMNKNSLVISSISTMTGKITHAQ